MTFGRSAVLTSVLFLAACPKPSPGAGDGGTGSDAGQTADAGEAVDAGGRVDAGSAGDGGSVGDGGQWGLDQRLTNATCHAPPRPTVVPTGSVTLQPVFAQLSTGPGGLAGTNAPVTARRVLMPSTEADPLHPGHLKPARYHWFIGLRSGRIAVVDDPAATQLGPNLRDGEFTGDLSTSETGLQGMAFDPDVATDPARAFVYFVTAQLGDYSLKRGTVVTSGDAAAGFSYRLTDEVTVFHASASNHHHAGDVKFGPDGLLYFTTGEGEVGARTQSPRNLRGKVLRIDVHTPGFTTYYGIPNGNPYRLDSTGQANAACTETGPDQADQPHDCPEVFARGFRNPFRFSFDAVGGVLWLGDTGAAHEEINLIEAGKNYGWNTYEGPLPQGNPNFTPSWAELPRTGCTPAGYGIIGGAVYRGRALPALYGKYVAGDEVTAKLFALENSYSPDHTLSELFNSNCEVTDMAPVEFTEDEEGELYVLSLNPTTGRTLFKLVPTSSQPADAGAYGPAALLSATGCVTAAGAPIAAAIPYGVNVELWADGLQKRRWLVLPDGATASVNNGHLELPVGSVVLKEFFDGDRHVETRLLVRHDDGDWAGYTYAWNAAQTDAVLQDATIDVAVDGGTWSVPSRGQCLSCHTTSKQRTLGLELRQLNRDFVYPSGRTANQLETLAHVGAMPAVDVAGVEALPALHGPDSVERRARAYLHVNCSMCHPGPGAKPDFSLETPFAQMQLCNVAPSSPVDGGVALLVPGSPSTSVLTLRMAATDGTRMPRLGSHRVDAEGLALISQWVSQISSCP